MSSVKSSRRVGLALCLAVAALAGCGGGGGGGGGGSSGPSPSKVFFTDGGNGAIVSFSTVTPTAAFNIDRVVEGPHTGLPSSGILAIPSIALDAAHDRLYVATQGNTFVYNSISTADGDVAPSVTMSATINTGTGNRGVNFAFSDLNRTTGALYSMDFAGEVHVINSPLTTPTAVSRLINPDLGATTVLGGFGLALDPANDMLYAGVVFSGTGSSNIIVYNNASTIGTAPTTITPVAPSRTLSFANAVGSFFLDTVHDRLYVSQATGVVLVFDNAHTLATGTPTPNRTIDLGGGTAIQFYIFVDTSRDKLYVVASNTGAQVGAFAYVDNASTANDPVPDAAVHAFTFSGVPNIALSAIAVAP